MSLSQAGTIYREEGFGELASRCGTLFRDEIFKIPGLDSIALRKSINILHQHQEEEDSVEDVINTAFSYKGVGRYRTIRPLQVRSELLSLAKIISEQDPQTIVEIGSAQGGTLYCWTRVTNASVAISIDLPGGPFGGGYSSNHRELFNAFDDTPVEPILRDSSNISTLRPLRTVLESHSAEGPEIDFLFIDGDHTYEGVKSDFEQYSRFVSEDGIIALHDILPHYDDLQCEVDRFWDELQGSYETDEIIEDPSQGWGGIGLVYP